MTSESETPFIIYVEMLHKPAERGIELRYAHDLQHAMPAFAKLASAHLRLPQVIDHNRRLDSSLERKWETAQAALKRMAAVQKHAHYTVIFLTTEEAHATFDLLAEVIMVRYAKPESQGYGRTYILTFAEMVMIEVIPIPLEPLIDMEKQSNEEAVRFYEAWRCAMRTRSTYFSLRQLFLGWLILNRYQGESPQIHALTNHFLQVCDRLRAAIEKLDGQNEPVAELIRVMARAHHCPHPAPTKRLGRWLGVSRSQ